MPKEIDWFNRLAEVPGVGYEPQQPLPRPALWNARPQIFSYDDGEGRKVKSLMWPSEDGGETSASPAQSHGLSDRRNASAREVTANLRETLELPGDAGDYHFALQLSADALWARRKEDPSLIETVVELCLLNIRLIEARPEAVTDQYAKGPISYYSVTAFRRLVDVYRREGLVREALAVSRRGERFDQAVDLEELEAQVAALDAEPVP
jgi:hypothetical protein